MLNKIAGSAPIPMRFLLGAIFSLIIALGLVFRGVHSRAENADRLQVRADRMAIPTVTLITANAAPIASTNLLLPGRLEAYTRAPIFARTAGYLKRWHADIGDPVKTGQLLAEIDTPELDQQLRQAQAELNTAKANAALAATTAKRWQTLLAQNFASAQVVEEKNGDLAVKQSLVNVAQANLDRLLETKKFARVLAPFSGVVTARTTDIGALIAVGGAPGTELFVVSELSRVRLYVNVPQTLVGSIKQGGKASFSQPQNPDQSFPARVQSLARAIGVGSGTMLVQLLADAPSSALVPGSSVNVRFDAAQTGTHLKVPPSVLIYDKTGVKVATVDATNHVLLKSVIIARDDGVSVALASGLNAEDRIIESPPDGITNGELVRVKTAHKPASN
jgi:hypothetical protein